MVQSSQTNTKLWKTIVKNIGTLTLRRLAIKTSQPWSLKFSKKQEFKTWVWVIRATRYRFWPTASARLRPWLLWARTLQTLSALSASLLISHHAQFPHTSSLRVCSWAQITVLEQVTLTLTMMRLCLIKNKREMTVVSSTKMAIKISGHVFTITAPATLADAPNHSAMTGILKLATSSAIDILNSAFQAQWLSNTLSKKPSKMRASTQDTMLCPGRMMSRLFAKLGTSAIASAFPLERRLTQIRERPLFNSSSTCGKSDTRDSSTHTHPTLKCHMTLIKQRFL